MKISVVIPTRGKPELVRKCIEHLRASVLPRGCTLEVLILEQGGSQSRLPSGRGYGDAETFPVSWAPAQDGWSYAQINNFGAQATRGDLLLLNNDCFLKPDCLGEMIGAIASDTHVGIVGAKLLYEDGRIQHVGVTFKSSGVPVHSGRLSLDDGSVAAAGTDGSPDAVTFACALIRRACWTSVGGLDPAYHFNYEDVDFCLSARQRGWEIRFAHKARAVHLEDASIDSRTSYDHSVDRNFRVLKRKWLESGEIEAVLKRPFPAARSVPTGGATHRSLLARVLAEVGRGLFRSR